MFSGNYSNGQNPDLFLTSIAKFVNPQGLEKVGHNLYAETPSSGNAVTGQPGTNGMGIMASNTLEQSNVDIADEIVDTMLIRRVFNQTSKSFRYKMKCLEVSGHFFLIGNMPSPVKAPLIFLDYNPLLPLNENTALHFILTLFIS